jgi:hypothetical protein
MLCIGLGAGLIARGSEHDTAIGPKVLDARGEDVDPLAVDLFLPALALDQRHLGRAVDDLGQLDVDLSLRSRASDLGHISLGDRVRIEVVNLAYEVLELPPVDQLV